MRKKRSKGQAALEYLMTYGWSLAVVLVMIGALNYFGVVTPSVPDICTVDVGITCIQVQVEESDRIWGGHNHLFLGLRNDMPYDIYNVKAEFALEGYDTSNIHTDLWGEEHNETNIINIPSQTTTYFTSEIYWPFYENGARIEGDILISYREAGKNYVQTKRGKISVKVGEQVLLTT